MKKVVCVVTALLILLSMAACGTSEAASETKVTVPGITEALKDTTPKETQMPEEPLPQQTESVTPGTSTDLKSLEDEIEEEVESTLDNLTLQWEELAEDVEDYDSYLEKAEEIEAFYGKILGTSEQLCISLYVHSVTYVDLLINSGADCDDLYQSMGDFYDLIYDDMGSELYDGIYSGILEEMYDAFYSGALEDRPQNVPYGDWSDVRSAEYDLWSDARSDTYDHWSDFRSDVYDFWSDIRSELWDDNLEGAQEELEDFREDVEKILSKSAPREEQPETTSPETTPETGLRPDFVEAMDSYEAFMDEYVEFMKKYLKNPSDTRLLSDYAKFMTEYVEYVEAFEKWESEDLNAAELAYYLEVQNRVTQKLLEISQ